MRIDVSSPSPSLPAARTCPARQRGASLLELVVFIVIVGTALAGVLSVLNVSVLHSVDPVVRKQMLAIAESLLDEVQLQPFTFCDPAKDVAKTAANAAACGAGNLPSVGPPGGGADRSLYNNVSNYSGLTLGTPNNAASVIADMSNVQNNASPAGYWATIAVATDGNLGGIAAAEVLRITVEVHSVHTNETIVLEGWRSRWAPNT
jgi:MSHA pilin protein MshD